MKLRNGFSAEQIAGCISSKRLELTILPTEKCNFRCTYCYEDFEIGRMNPRIRNAVKKLISVRAGELSELAISWFGGEPLVALPVILEIAGHAHNLAQEHGFALTGGLTTNGYLLSPEALRSLVELNQDFFQITLDGWGDVHDRTRRRADGGPTFDRIWSNLCAASETDLKFEILLRIHLTDSNFESLKRLCEEIRKRFGKDDRYRLDFQDVRDLGGAGGSTVTPLAATEFKKMVAELLCIAEGRSALGDHADAPEPTHGAKFDLEQLDVKTGESAAGRRAYEIKKGLPYICYAAKPNHYLIRADGRVGKCTVALDKKENTIGRINDDGTLSVDQDLARKWYAGLANLDIDQLGCPLPFVSSSDSERITLNLIEDYA